MTDLPDMSYRAALEELRLRFEVNKIPERVMASFLGVLKHSQDRLFVVQLDGLTDGAPDLCSHLHASKRLMKLVLAMRSPTFDWEEIIVLIEHLKAPLQHELAPV